ncbi:hypothetical protein HH303_11525 [Rhodospirillaceae bacterium KN72]|uniref:Uncharacterized protein n=1 Tax=Pacificispira spongiicola TaxID=2729598 RepID=A0A7Y0HGM7_9PROT|nr:hypothetical protein [Pacificispira spongiicola]NMM45112.1 hypothetical protein [Pacificispira spongiicola]
MNSAGSSNAKKGGAGTLLPPTFLKRGIFLPFTTTVVRYARLRRAGGSGLEFLIPGLSGGFETYIIPYKVLPETLNLSVHDRALHEEMAQLRDVSPVGIRALGLRVAATGLGGPVLARRAKLELDNDRIHPTQVLFALVLSAIRQLAASHPGASSLTAESLATPDGMKLAREALGGYAQTIGERGDKVYAKLEKWSKTIAPLGAPDGFAVGYLTLRIVDLENLANELTKWLIQEPPETAEMAQRTGTAIRAAVEAARATVAKVDSMAENMADPLRTFDEAHTAMAEAVSRVSYILDGWQRILDMWTAARSGDRFTQRDTLEEFCQHLPILPQEAVGNKISLWEGLRESQAFWRRNSQMNLGADLDEGTRDKLSNFRKENV